MPATNRIYPFLQPSRSHPQSSRSFSSLLRRSSIQVASPLGLLNLWYARCRVTRPRPCICRPAKEPKDQRNLCSAFELFRLIPRPGLPSTTPPSSFFLLAFILSSLPRSSQEINPIPGQAFRDSKRYCLLKLIYYARGNKVGGINANTRLLSY